MSSYEEVVPPHHIRELMLQVSDTLIEVDKYVTAADKRERAADERAKQTADAHREGWKLVARAITDGLGAIARAIDNNGRR